MYRDSDITELWEFLVDLELTTEDALTLLTNVAGYSLDVLEGALYALTGYRTLEQAKGDFNE